MTCKKCGAEIPVNEKICPNCGAEIIPTDNNTAEPAVKLKGYSMKKNIVIIALAGVLALGGGVIAVAINASNSVTRSSMKGSQPADTDTPSNVPPASITGSTSDPAESKPVYSSMGSVMIAGTELDIAATEKLLIYNKKLYENGTWHYASDDWEKKYDSIVYLNGDLTREDLDKLTGLTQLKRLEIYYAGITDITPLAGLKNLSALHLRNNQFSDITPLAMLTNLKYLSLDDNQISDITSLAGLTNLNSLYLDCNYDSLGKISDISPLAGLTNLNNLGLSYNQISDITPLAGLTNLKTLYLRNNSIGDITPLTGLTNLKGLYLENNSIGDIIPLAGLTNLETLYLNHNPIIEEDVTWLLAQLSNCKIKWGYFDF